MSAQLTLLPTTVDPRRYHESIAASSPSPHRPSRWGEGRSEGQLNTPTSAFAAAHPNPLPACGERGYVSAIIPCLDEEDAIGRCVAAVLAHGLGSSTVNQPIGLRNGRQRLGPKL